jgi:hypothetical protein
VKVLFPAVTCLVTSHMKPMLRDELASLVGQTRRDLQIIVADSGQWIGRDDPTSLELARTYEEYSRHPLVDWVTTGESRHLRHLSCPVGLVFNEVVRAGLVRGRYMHTGYDDDVHDRRYVELMAGYLDTHPEAMAVWCSQDRVQLLPDGGHRLVGQILAGGPKLPGGMDCQVDGTQVMWRTAMLNVIGDPWLPEDPTDSVCRHSDGLFLEKLASAAGVIPAVPDILVTHRHTSVSTYSPM